MILFSLSVQSVVIRSYLRSYFSHSQIVIAESSSKQSLTDKFYF